MADFGEHRHCRRCGLSASESDNEMQEDLSNLMTRNLHLSNTSNLQPPPLTTSNPPTPPSAAQPSPNPYSITQHYHHSAHQVPMSTQNDIQPSQTLIDAGIDASVLSPTQLHLFKHAPPDQQLRLIQLWRIAPPTYDQQLLAKNLGNWPQTSLEQEEEAARHRWDNMGETERQARLATHDADSSMEQEPEPYIAHGYSGLPNINGVTAPSEHGAPRTMEYNRAHDPVYRSREWWRHFSDKERMEHQYGMLEQMRINGYGAVDMDGDMEML